MATVSLEHVSLSFGDRPVLSDVGLTLSSGSKVALTGANGSGKTTLMRIIVGETQPDSGSVVRSRDSVVSYLPQSGLAHRGRSLWQEADAAYEHFHRHQEELHELEGRLSTMDQNSPELAPILEAYEAAQDRLLQGEYYDRDSSIDRTLRGLGFRADDFGRPCEEFSGGWQMRIALARILLESPDVLLLDEPTNYLDIEAREWLASHLSSFSGALLLVSHDRHFLDTVTTETAELFLARLRIYPMAYSAYRERREQEIESLTAAYARQQEEIARTEDFIRRFRYKATKAKQVQSRVKQLDKMERIELPEHLKTISVRFPAPPRSGDPVLELEGIGRSYEGRKVLENVGFSIRRGDRLVFVGANGAGKSTLMRIVAGIDREFRGKLHFGTAVETGYFPQDAAETMPKGRTALEIVAEAAPEKTEGELRGLLGAFLFRGDDVYKPTDVLSGGERNRLAMLRLLVRPRNLLILDEPTNHLDMSSKDVLLDALSSYTGTLVLVSHDRYFLESIATRVLHFESSPEGPSTVTYYHGDYDYFLYRRGAQQGDEVRSGVGAEKAGDTEAKGAEAKGAEAKDPGATLPAMGREERKVAKSRLRRLEEEEETLLARIDEIEAARRRTEEALADPTVYADGEAVRRHTKDLEMLAADREQALSRWEEVSTEAERLRGLIAAGSG